LLKNLRLLPALRKTHKMATEIITRDDLNEFRKLLLPDIRLLLNKESEPPQANV